MENYLIIDHEPFVGYMPNDIRNWLTEHPQESDIASAMMIVHNKVDILMDVCEEVNDPWANYAFEEWNEIETELAERIRGILSVDNRTKDTNYTLDGIGTYYMVKPFMERNGYRDASGWWIKKRDAI